MYDVLYKNSKGEKTFIGNADSKPNAFTVIDIFLSEHNYKSYYKRTWEINDKTTVVDVGDYLCYFYIQKNKIEKERFIMGENLKNDEVVEFNMDEMDIDFPMDLTYKIIFNVESIMPDIIDYTYNSETATTKIKWSDKTVTTVTAENIETADQYTGFVTAYAKKAAGNNSRINNLYDKWAVEKPIKDKIAEEKRIADEAEKKRIAEKRKTKKEKWLIQKEALRIKREYEAKKLARDKYGIPMDEGSDE